MEAQWRGSKESALQGLAKELDQCIKCGLCQATCPVQKELLLEKYAPRGKVQLARHYASGELSLSEHMREIFARCLLCGSCSVTCPSGVDLTHIFTIMRREIAENRGLHPRMEGLIRFLQTSRNISGEDNKERGEWRDLLKGLPAHAYEKERAEVVYFVGCVASFYPMVQGIPQNLVRIMDSAGVDFAILAGGEWCCGFPMIGAGISSLMQEFQDHNLSKIEALGAKEVVFSCPSCYRVWKESYHRDLRLSHSTEFMERLIGDERLTFGEVPLTLAYHDPCDLGRHGKVFDAPRKVLQAIPGLRLVELENNRAKSVCCGGGGNVEMADPELSARVAERKIQEIMNSGVKTVVTSCQQCVRTLKAKARRQKIDLEVLDITDVVLKSTHAAKG